MLVRPLEGCVALERAGAGGSRLAPGRQHAELHGLPTVWAGALCTSERPRHCARQGASVSLPEARNFELDATYAEFAVPALLERHQRREYDELQSYAPWPKGQVTFSLRT